MWKNRVYVLSLLLVTSYSFAAVNKQPPIPYKQAPQEISREDSNELVPPKLFPVEEKIALSCGYVVRHGMIFFFVRTTSFDVLTNPNEGDEETIHSCVKQKHTRQTPHEINEIHIGEHRHDGITCSAQKIPGYPVTYTAISVHWQYLHLGRIGACFKKLEEDVEKQQQEQQLEKQKQGEKPATRHRQDTKASI